jgi:very-short-patch-repair endonuclease
MGADAVDHRLATGRLHVVHRGVYAVGRRGLSIEGRWMAAVLAGGDRAVLSHRSAAELWGLLPRSSRTPDVTVPNARDRRDAVGIVWHSRTPPDDEVTVVAGIPATTVPRTILDLAAVAGYRTVERAMNEAEIRGLGDRLPLHRLLARYPGRRGIRTVRMILAVSGLGTRRTRSELEEALLGLVRRYGLLEPELNATLWIDGRFFEADCMWRRQRLIVEADGRAVHGTAAAFENDRARDRALSAAGWQVIRVTNRQLTEEPAAIARDIRALLQRDTR